MLFYANTGITIASAPVRTLNEYTIQEQTHYFAEKYGSSSSQLGKVMFCESRNNPKAWNKNDPNGGSKGLMQFQTSTFYKNAARIGIEKPDIWNQQQQIEVAAYMFAQKQQHQWSCFNILYS